MKPHAQPTFALVFAVALSARAIGQVTVIDTFDPGSNLGGWVYGSPNGATEGSGGNPGSYWRDDFLDTFAPQPGTTTVGSVFTGDYRALGATTIGVDLITHYVDFSAGGRRLTVMLVSDNSTPGNFDDDWAAYRIGTANIPLVGQGWLSYTFDVPAASTTLPMGWKTIGFGPQSPRRPDWNAVIASVSQLRFFYGDPELFYIFQVWDVGLDNARITYVPAPDCPGDLNGDNVVDLADLSTLLANYGSTSATPEQGDLDGDADVDLEDLSDLLANYGATC